MSLIVRETAAGRDALGALGLSRVEDLLDCGRGEAVRVTPLRRTNRIRAGEHELYLKSYDPGAGRAGKVAGSRAPAAVEWEANAALAAVGIRVPDALCAVWSSAGDRGASALLLGAVEGARPLDTVLDGKPPGAKLAPWLDDLARLVARLHGLGFQHRDLYACHLLVEPGWSAPPTLIDLARVRRSRRLPLRRRVKDLAALHYSLAPRLSRTRLLRMFEVYAGGRTSAHADLARRVLRKSARIARHEPLYG